MNRRERGRPSTEVLRLLWREHRLLFLGFVAACAVTLFFAARLIHFSLYWADPAHRNQPLEAWMTPRYVARSYDLPLALVRDALELEPGARRRRTLDEIARDSGLTLDEMTQRVTQAAAGHHGSAE